jgi:chromosome segregation ATPase
VSHDPVVAQLCGQIRDWSTTCAGLSKALDELQKAHGGVKADYERFLQGSVRNQEKLVGIVEKREAEVLKLRNQHSIDVKKLIASIADSHTELEQMKTELDSTRAARDHLSKEGDDLKLDLQAAVEEVVRVTNVVRERDEDTRKEIAQLQDQLQQRHSSEEALRQQIVSEKAQRLKAIQCLTEAFADGNPSGNDSLSLRKDSASG